MEQCSHNWNGEYEEKCLCTKCSINHDWKEIGRQVVTETRGEYNANSGAASAGTSFEDEVIYVASKCEMCGKEKEEKISFK
jgi:hypothetical protein